MIDFGVFPSLSLERPSVVTSFQLYVVCMMRIIRLYDENKSSLSLNELRQNVYQNEFHRRSFTTYFTCFSTSSAQGIKGELFPDS